MIGGEKFRFDKETHTYWLGENKLIGVSEAMKAAGLGRDYSKVDPMELKHARDRGIAVHAACHYLDDGDLKWETVSQEIEPYVRAWDRFKEETKIIIREMEHPLYHATLGFAGTPDRIVIFGGHTGILDIKTYRPDDITGVQLAAYSLLAFGQQPLYDPPKRWGVWLKDDGKYKLEPPFENRGDEAVFLSCLTISKFKRGMK